MFRCSRKFYTGTIRKLVFHVHFGKWKAPNVSEILLVFSLEVRAFSQQDASKVGC